MGRRKRHLASFICRTMINGLAFRWSVLPLHSLWASPHTRGSFRENGPHKYCSLSQTARSQHPSALALITGKPAKQGCALMRKSTGGLFCAFATRNSAHACDVCAGRDGETTGRQEEGEKSVWRLKKSQHTTLHWHVSPLLLLRHSELCLRGTWVDLGES